MCKSGCGGATDQAISDMNKKGIYTPKQIKDQFFSQWDAINSNGDAKVSKKDFEKICKQTINTLGKNGGGDKFQSKKFNEIIEEKFKDQDEFDKKQCVKIVTQMMVKKTERKPSTKE